MTIITSHQNLDFDGLASMAAASKLYENAELFMPWSLNKAVKKFHTLFKHKFILKKEKDIDFSGVTKVVIVDGMSKVLTPSLKKVVENKNVEAVIYNHHKMDDDIKAAGAGEIDISYGACTTYFVERLFEEKTEISKEEALLYLLGIYSNTGYFTYPNTTPEDLKAAAKLMDSGVNKKMLADFLGRNFDSPQIKLFNRLVKNMQQFEIKGYRVIITYARFKQYIQQLNEVTTQVMAINSADAIVSVAQMENKIFMAARSEDVRIDIRKVMREFKGGGHKTAAAAVVPVKKGVSIKTIKDKVYNGLMSVIKEKYTVKDIMSSPVRAIPPSLTMEEAYKIAIRFNNNGLPVVKNDKLVGFITKEDMEKGILHRLGSIPVGGYMSGSVITVEEATTVTEAQQKMLRHNIGHLPVVEEGKLKGIVTRTDVLEFLYKEKPLQKERIVFEEKDINVRAVMEEKIDPEIYTLIKKTGEYADEYGVNAYLVGGMVRDLFLREKDIDVDITVEGDGMAFARFIADKFKGAYKGFERFKTAKVFLKGGKRIDVTSARAEFYEYPAALPAIEFTPIRYDLFRRDFTINAMAIKINRNEFGRFTDYFNGYDDLKKGIIRTLYNMSFIDDPTRIIRAIRFEQRFGFKIEENTLRFIKETLKYNILDTLSGERLRDEFVLLLEEVNPLKAVKRMENFGVLSRLNEGMKIDEKTEKAAKKAVSSPGIFEAAGCLDKPLVYLMIFTRMLSEDQMTQLVNRLKLSNDWKKKMQFVRNGEKRIMQALEKKEVKNSRIFEALRGSSTEALVYFILISHSKTAEQNIKKYMSVISGSKTEITGNDLKKLGIKEGPVYREILQKVAKAKIDGRVRTKKKELAMAAKLVKKIKKAGS